MPSRGIVISESDSITGAYEDLLNYQEWLEFETHPPLTIEVARWPRPGALIEDVGSNLEIRRMRVERFPYYAAYVVREGRATIVATALVAQVVAPDVPCSESVIVSP